MLCPIHTDDADATQLLSWVASAVCIEFATNSGRIWFGRKLKTEHAENLSSRVGCGIGNLVITPPDTTQIDSACPTFNSSSKSVDSRRELLCSCEFTTHRATPTRLNWTIELCRRCVLRITNRGRLVRDVVRIFSSDGLSPKFFPPYPFRSLFRTPFPGVRHTKFSYCYGSRRAL